MSRFADFFVLNEYKRQITANIKGASLDIENVTSAINAGAAVRVVDGVRKELQVKSGESGYEELMPEAEKLGLQTSASALQKEFISPAAEGFEQEGMDALHNLLKQVHKEARDLEDVESVPYIDLKALRSIKKIHTAESIFKKTEIIYTGFIYIKVASATDAQADGWFFYEKNLSDIDIKNLVRVAYSRAKRKLNAQPISGGQYTVIFDANVSESFIELWISMLDFQKILRKRSPFSTKLGQVVAEPKLNLAIVPGLFDEAPFDDEGIMRQEVQLIKGGRLEGFLKDRYTAALGKQESNGCALRYDYMSEPQRHGANVVLEAEMIDWKDALAQTGRIILVTDVSGLHTIDEITGDFSLGIEGVFYEDGKPKTAVNSMTMAGNMLELMQNFVVGVGPVERFGTVFTPKLMFRNVRIGGE